MNAWMNGSTSAGRGVLKSGLLIAGEMTLTVGMESAVSSASSAWRACQRGTKPMARPMSTSTTAIPTIRLKRMGGGAFEDGFEFMVLLPGFWDDIENAGA